MVPDGPRAIEDTEDGLQTAQNAPKRPQEASKMRPKRASGRKKLARPLRRTWICSINSPLGCPTLPDGPRGPQDRTKT
eukprot:50680-Pyramimonas_sp.AAC.1